MTASDYPITFGYGLTTPPYGTPEFPYHRGEDRYMPDGTPVLVNGVQIGLSGHTGFVTGPHLHIGRFVNGKDTNPNGDGFTLKDPVKVTDVGYNDKDGNYVGVNDGDGVRWVYLHLSLQTIAVGHIINEEEVLMQRSDVVAMFPIFTGSEATEQDLSYWDGKPWDVFTKALSADPRVTVQKADVDFLWGKLMTAKPSETDYTYAQKKNWNKYVHDLLGDPRCISVEGNLPANVVVNGVQYKPTN